MNCLIVGYGIVGHNLREEIKRLNPDIYDKYNPENNTKKNIKYDLTFICVDTPLTENYLLDITEVRNAINENNSELYVIKSTCPIGTVERLKNETNKRIVFSPEYYGATQHNNNFKFDFTILGGDKEDCIDVIQILMCCYDARHQFRITNSKTAELTKFMVNSFLATKVSFCNQFYNLCQDHGISYEELRELFILDERINNSHTFVYKKTPYWDTHCLNKDVPYVAYHENAVLLQEVCEFNEMQKMISKDKYQKYNCKLQTTINNIMEYCNKVSDKTDDYYIYNKEHIIKDLTEDGIRLQNYDDSVKNNLELIKIAILSNPDAYNFIGDKYKLNPEVIDTYWSSYINQDEIEKDYINLTTDGKYINYIPEYLNLNYSSDEIINDIVKKRSRGDV